MAKIIILLNMILFAMVAFLTTIITTQTNTVTNPTNYISLTNNFIIFKQEQKYYCLPATVKSVVNYINNNLLSQHNLADEMKTDIENINGTTMENATPILNKYVNFSLRPGIKQYQNYLLTQNFGETDKQKLLFQNAVKFSLENNMPVILGIKGTPPWWKTEKIIHVIAITAICIYDNPDDTVYYVSDPYDKTTNKTFKGTDLINMFTLASSNILIPSKIV